MTELRARGVVVRERTAGRLSSVVFWATAGLGFCSVVAIALGAAVTFGGGDRSQYASGLAFGAALFVGAAGVSLLGMLMVRRAHNVIGWAFQTMGLAAVLSLATDALLQLTLGRTRPIHPFGISVAGWLSSIAVLGMVLPIPAIFLLFPTGRPLSDRWRWVIRLWTLGVGVALLYAAFRPGEVYGNPPPHRVHVNNPFGIPLGGVFAVLATAAGVMTLVVFHAPTMHRR
jgi:hypothetical protein